MAVTATPVFLQTPKMTPQNFVQGVDAAGTFKTLFTAGSNGTKIVSVVVSTDDGSATHVLTLSVNRGGTRYVLGAYTLPVNSGTSGSVANVDMLRGGPSNLIVGLPRDNDGQPYINLESGDTLDMTFATALTASKRIDVITTGANF